MMTLTTALSLSMALTVVGLVCASIRLILGPSRADRVVSLDLITILLVAIAAQLSLMYEVAAYLDLGLAIALIGFLATVAFARYIELAPQGQIADEVLSAAERQAMENESSTDHPSSGEAQP